MVPEKTGLNLLLSLMFTILTGKRSILQEVGMTKVLNIRLAKPLNRIGMMLA